MDVDPNKVIAHLKAKVADLSLDHAILQAAVEQLNEELYAAHTEIETLEQLTKTKGE